MLWLLSNSAHLKLQHYSKQQDVGLWVIATTLGSVFKAFPFEVRTKTDLCRGKTNSVLSFLFFTYCYAVKPTNLFITFNQGRLYILSFNLVVLVKVMHFQEAKPIMSNTCDPPEVPSATHCLSCAACPYLLFLWSLPFASLYKLKWSSMLVVGGVSLLQLGYKTLKITHDGGKGNFHVSQSTCST